MPRINRQQILLYCDNDHEHVIGKWMARLINQKCPWCPSPMRTLEEHLRQAGTLPPVLPSSTKGVGLIPTAPLSDH